MAVEASDADADDAVDVVDEIVAQRDALRLKARSILGIEGDNATEVPPLREILESSGTSWYPLLALGAFVVVDNFQATALFVLGPDVARSLGIGPGTLTLLIALKALAAGAIALPIAAAVQHHPRRAIISIISAFIWSIVTVYTGFVTGLIALGLVLVIDGASTGSVQAVHLPLLLDNYPPKGRVRVIAAYRGADSLGGVVALLGVALLTTAFALTWRGVFVVLGCLSFGGAIYGVRLRDPGFGRWDTSKLRELVRSGEADTGVSQLQDDTRLGFFEIVRRLFLIESLRRFLAYSAVIGIMLFPLQTFFAFFLEEQWGMGPGARALFLAGNSSVSLIALALFGRRGENLYRRDPARLMTLTAWLVIASVISLAIGALMPVFGLMLLFFNLAFAMVPALFPGIWMAALGVVPPAMRPHTQALMAIFTTGVGGLAGAVLLGSIERRFGIVGSLLAITVPGIIGALILRSVRTTIMDDVDRLIDEVVEEEEIKEFVESGNAPPLLACRGIDFSYGQLQVLFDVDFTVQQGEMVALLGVNGAGKSTLLRAISGIGLPDRGSVRLHGVDITYLDAQRRTRLGVNQIPGGRAVFGPLSVIENIRLFAYTLDGVGSVDSAIETSFETFPRLAERRNQSAQTLSGGEQQMLALTKALILKPKLLLIDELSLGLAPVIVAQLLEMVRKINDDGTAVVLVEQSVNLALSLVDHAYFMEKGEIRFDGKAKDLLAREDLLRSVFLEGVAGGGSR